MSSSDENENSGRMRANADQSVPAQTGIVHDTLRRETSVRAEKTTRPAELASSIQYLETVIAGMQEIDLTVEDRAVLEELIAALAKLLS